MWHFCLALDPLHLCAEREFDTSRGGYTPLKWPLGQARDEKKNLGPGPGLRIHTHILYTHTHTHTHLTPYPPTMDNYTKTETIKQKIT